MNAFLKSNTIETPPIAPPAEPAHSSLGVVTSESRARAVAAAGDQAIIAKGLVLHGEITGAESLFVDGRVEGSISLPGNRVTVGHNGQVHASISAREVVVMGKVRGNVSASDRVDIRAEGAVTGDLTAARISIEDGAFFKGGIDIRKPETRPSLSVAFGAGPREALKQA